MKLPHSQRRQILPYLTRDGSLIRELLHPDHQPVVRQSLAEAEVASGATTHCHYHCQSEEIYYFLSGSGEMVLGEDRFVVTAGDSVVIAPLTPHQLINCGSEPLRLLCCCSPPYRHEDTVLVT
jgi:mannose-6-phosphate isomerase-like protein (cupin superfamily)